MALRFAFLSPVHARSKTKVEVAGNGDGSRW